MLCDYCNCSLHGTSPVETDKGKFCDSTCAELAEHQDTPPYQKELSLAYEGQQLELELKQKGGNLTLTGVLEIGKTSSLQYGQGFSL